MVYEDAEKLYAEVRRDTEALTEEALRVIYPGSLSLSSAPSGPLTLFAHNTTPFSRRDIVRVPLGGGTSTGNVLQTTSDGKEGYVVLEGGPGGGIILPSQISSQDLKGARFPHCLEHVDLFNNRGIGVTAQSASSEHFVLRNENMRLTVSDGRITSLFDVRLQCVSSSYTSALAAGKSAGILLIHLHALLQTRAHSAGRDRRSGNL